MHNNKSLARAFQGRLSRWALILIGCACGFAFSVHAQDTTAPANTTATNFINAGAVATNSITTTLAISATDAVGVTAYRPSESSTTPTAASAGWVNITATTSYSANVSFTLSTGDAVKTVYVWFKDAAGNVSAVKSDTITLDTVAPAISAVAASGVTSSAATVTWTTNEASNTQVDYGTTTAYGSSRTTSTLVTSHSRSLSGLTPLTLYHYRVKSTDAAGNLVTGTDNTFTTTANVAPTVSLTAPANNSSFAAPATINLTAAAADSDGSVSKVEFFQGATLIATDTTSPYSATWSNVAAGTYTLTAKATDNRNAVTTSTAVTVTVTASTDTTAPANTTAANFINAGAAATNSITTTLAISATDAVGVTAYRPSESSTTPTAASTGWVNVTPTSSYAANVSFTLSTGDAVKTVYLWFKDAAGNVSAVQSDTITLDTVAPTISTVTQSGVTATGATITWTTNEAANTQVDYGTTTSYGSTATTANSVTSHSQALTGLTASTLYHYRVKSTDAAGNLITGTDNSFTTAATNAVPTTSLTAPTNNSSYTAPATINLAATATDSDGTITKVEFYQGSTLIVTDTTSPYSATWANVPAGNYSLTAKATDNQGAVTTSTPISVTVTNPAQAYYIHSDHLNTPRIISDQSQKTVWRWQNTEGFGNSLAEEDPDNDGTLFTCNLRYPGQYFDRETNLHYNYFRDYDPVTGRFVESDPIGLRGGINTFGYVNQNPLSFTDPQGLDPGMGGSTESCDWYAQRCAQSNGTSYYYCRAAPFFCKFTPPSPWTSCVRQCLQDFDRACSRNPDGSPSGCVIDAHAHCWLKCRAPNCLGSN